MAEKNKIKILVGEDEQALSRALELKLSHEGFDVKIAATGEDVLAQMAKEKFDLLLLDLVMPNMDGFAVLEELKKNSNKVPIIVTSNLGQEEDKKRVEYLGVSEYLIKSNTSISEMISKIKEFLGK